MYSVTQWIKSPHCKQPKEGLIPISLFSKTVFPTFSSLIPQKDESISPASVGDLVDLLTRYVLSQGDLVDTFRICIKGFQLAKEQKIFKLHIFGINIFTEAMVLQHKLFKKSKDTFQHLDKEFVGISYELLAGNAFFRAGRIIFPSRKSIDLNTLKNIQEMVSRTIKYLKNKSKGMQFYPGVFFQITKKSSCKWISAGDGDFLTTKHLIELKTSKYSVKNNHALQAVVYYLWGKELGDKRFDSVEYLCIFNPRLNEEHTLLTSKIPPEGIKEIYRQW